MIIINEDYPKIYFPNSSTRKKKMSGDTFFEIPAFFVYTPITSHEIPFS